MLYLRIYIKVRIDIKFHSLIFFFPNLVNGSCLVLLVNVGY